MLALIPKRLELPVSRGAGGHYSGAVVIPDDRIERAMGSAACKRHEDVLYQWLEPLEDQELPDHVNTFTIILSFIPVGPPLAVHPTGHRVDLE